MGVLGYLGKRIDNPTRNRLMLEADQEGKILRVVGIPVQKSYLGSSNNS